MTGVFFPGLEFPESCSLCPFVFRRFCPSTYHLTHDEFRQFSVDGRMKECPLVFVCYSGLNEV